MTTHRRIITTAAVALTLGATATPASAFINRPSSDAPGQPTLSPWAGPLALSHGSSGSVKPTPTIVHVSTPSSEFDWGDAGIGAAGGIAISMLGLGTALAVSGRRARRPAPHRA